MFDKDEFLNALLKKLQEETKQHTTEKGKEIGALIQSIGLRGYQDELKLISELNALTGIGIPVPINMYSSKLLTVVLRKNSEYPNYSKEYIINNIGVMLGNRSLLRANGNVTTMYTQVSVSLATEIDVINFVNYFITSRYSSNTINTCLRGLREAK